MVKSSESSVTIDPPEVSRSTGVMPSLHVPTSSTSSPHTELCATSNNIPASTTVIIPPTQQTLALTPPSQMHVIPSQTPTGDTTINIPPDPPHRHDGAYGGFMVVLPPPPTSQHTGEMTEYQRSQLQNHHQQHLILYGLAQSHPKPYTGCPGIPTAALNDDIGPPKVDFNAPPAYESVAKPPTYEDVQREKHFEERYLSTGRGGAGAPPPVTSRGNRPMTFLATIDAENPRDSEADALLGTDFMFITAFIVAFLFNWIGFLLLICFCHTVAARYGALSGFGVSLAKWTFIVRTSTEVTSHENDWLWWLIMAFGCIICIRAFLQYITIKRTWNTLSEQAQERFFFIY